MIKKAIEELIKYLLNLFQNIDSDLKKLQDELSIYDQIQQDLLHYLENHNMNAPDSCKLVKQLKKIREERREIKDDISIISSVKDLFVDRYKNKFIEKDLIKLLNSLNDIKDRQKNPTYKYRYLDENLEIKEI